MATSIIDGPEHVYGAMGGFPAPPFGSPVVDPNSDAAPSLFYQGVGIPDPRIVYLKDTVQGRLNRVQAFYSLPTLKSIGQIPAALASNNIAAAANAVSGVAMTLAAASVGITLAVPVHTFSNTQLGGAVVTAAMALDFGFAFGNCTANSTSVTVADSGLFPVGMPLVIGGVGNAGGTVPLLTSVASITNATTIVVQNAPLATNATAPIGTGDLWGGQTQGGQPLAPTAANPFLSAGPDSFLDPRQALTRGVQITGAGGSAGGTFTVVGMDIYGQPMTDTVTVGAASTGFSLKCFKYIISVTPNFSDAFNYSVGTSDLFGFAFRSGTWEDTAVYWAGAPMTSTQGWVTFDGTSPATAATGDVRGTIQTGTAGGGTGIGATASNGTVVSLAMSGNRLEMSQRINLAAMIVATPSNPVTLFGVTQA